MDLNLLTIVCISKDNHNQIEKTFSSIAKSDIQKKNKINIIHIDKSNNFIEAEKLGKEILFEFSYKFFYQKSSGIFNAFNEAINMVSSEYIYFLNTGDSLFDKKSLNLILEECQDEKKPDFIYFDIGFLYNNQLKIKISSKDLTKCLRLFSTEFPSHQACIFKTNLHKNIYYPSFFGSDEFVIRYFLKKCLSNFSYKYVSKVICLFDLDGISSRSKITLFQFFQRLYGYLAMGLYHRIFADCLKLYPICILRKTIIKIIRSILCLFENFKI